MWEKDDTRVICVVHPLRRIDVKRCGGQVVAGAVEVYRRI